MKAADWHQFARHTGPQPPVVRTVSDLRTMPARRLEAYIEERNAWLQYVQIPWAAGVRAQKRIDRIVKDNALRAPGAKNVVAVTAKHTAGKSTQVRAWANRFYRETLGPEFDDPTPPTWRPRPGVRAQDVPVCWIDLGSGKIRLFTTQVLSFFGYPTNGLIPDLIARFSDVVENHRLKLLVVDDINMLQLGDRDARQVLDHLKHINTVLGQHGGSLVLVGRRESNSLVYTDPQLAGRLHVIQLETFRSEPEHRAEWQEFLHGAEQVLLPYLPAAEPGLLPGSLAPDIWRRTQGFMGDTVDLLRQVMQMAAEDGSWTIRKSHVAAALLSERAKTEESVLPVLARAKRVEAQRQVRAAR